MIKQLFLVFSLIISVFVSQAQFTVGVKAGGNMSKESFTEGNYKTSFKPGFHFGPVARYLLAKNLRLQAELLYSAEGTKEENTGGTKGEIKRNFVQLPVLVQYMIWQSLYGETGPQLAYMLSAKEKFGNSGFVDILEYYKKLNLRWAIGAGYGLTAAIILNARYSFSITPINEHSVMGGDLKSHAIQLGIIYMLDK